VGDFFLSPEAGLSGLALSAFLSSTLLPGGSEAVLLLLVARAETNALVLILVATLANSLGGFSTYLLGGWLESGLIRHGFMSTPSARTISWARRWGYPSLLLSWLPIVGDGLCLAAGWLRMAWFPVLLAITLGKGARYWALVWLSGLVWQ
jgi:membrane protein YqaA with SNARE-associated domain